MEFRDNERRPKRETGNPKYSTQYPVNRTHNTSIPRSHLTRSTENGIMSERRESGDYRKGYRGDDRMFPKSHSSRHSDEETRRPSQKEEDRQELSRRGMSKSSDNFDNRQIGVSRMQYRNRGYEED